MSPEFRCELVSWHRIQQLSHALAARIRAADFRADAIVAIARGGYVPARLLCDLLDVSNLSSIRIVHYTAGAQRQQRARLTSSLCEDISGQNVVIVDDVSDTGDTLALARTHVEALRPAAVRTAVLHHKSVSAVIPDYYAQKIVKWRWIIYPWAVVEDVTGFLSRMQRLPEGPEAARVQIERDYGIRVPPQIIEDLYRTLR